MRRGVVILTPYFFPVMGGVESNAERLARYLVGGNEDVQVLTKRITADLPDEETRSGIRVRRIGPRGERSASGKWQLVPSAFAWLIRHAGAYDVVCCVDYRATGLAAILARGVTRRPVVFQAQTTGVVTGENANSALQALGFRADGAVARVLKRPISAFYGRADAIACISHEIEREALAAGVPRSRVHYFPNAIDMEIFRPAESGERDRLRQNWKLPREAVVAVFVGRLSREKGLEELLEAWRLMQQRAREPQNAATARFVRASAPPSRSPERDGTSGPPSGGPLLLIAGPDMTGHPWDVGVSGRAFVERHGLGDTVRFLGPVTDVPSLYRLADLAVQPSHFEALGLSAIEALASGVPVIASSVGGLPEFIVDDQNGRLCPPKDPERLAACLDDLLTDADLRGRLASRARASVRDEFDERLVFGRMRDLFERLAARDLTRRNRD